MSQAAELASTSFATDIDTILSSPESKATQTSKFFSESLGIETIIVPGLEEVHRGTVLLKTEEDYDMSVRRLFSKRGSAPHGWETAIHALNRFERALRTALARNRGGEGTLVVSHGIIPSLYFAKLLDVEQELYDRWKSVRFCAWGVIRGDAVIRDLT
jgi:broad specificity phosphatase PhoE